MVRIVIQYLAIFLVPILLYSAYFLVVRQRAHMGGQPKPSWEDGPWYWLVASGLALMILSFAVFGLFGGNGPDSVFQPPRIVDGEIQPGKVTK